MGAIVILDENKEVVACVSSNSKDGILKKGYELVEYGSTEPLFKEVDGKIYLSKAFEIRLDKESEG